MEAYKMRICTVENCDHLIEGNTDKCATHNKLSRRVVKPKKIYKTPSKNPKDWSNTFLCSDGTRVTQAEINERLKQTYAEIDDCFCKGCGEVGNSHAHIIAQARCKKIGKTELIWNRDNIFWSDFKCNAAIENPKGEEWKTLRNIDQCIQFIYEHDKELYFKFEAQGWQAKIKENEKI